MKKLYFKKEHGMYYTIAKYTNGRRAITQAYTLSEGFDFLKAHEKLAK